MPVIVNGTHVTLLDVRASHASQEACEAGMGTGPIDVGQALGAILGATGCIGLSGCTGASGLYAPVEVRRTRGRRLDRVKSLTLAGPIRLEERATPSELEDLLLEPRPKTWAECRDMPRPCPYVSCRHHLYIEVNPVTGSVQFPFGNLELDEVPYTCSIDAALDGPMTLDEIGKVMNRTKERVRQLETRSLVLVQSVAPSMLNATMAELLEET